MKLRHEEDFEKEAYYHQVFAQVRCDCPVLRDKTSGQIIARFAPDFINGIIAVNPCIWKLMFVGFYDSEDDAAKSMSPLVSTEPLTRSKTTKTAHTESTMCILTG
jgi:hypothetical protein